MTRKDIDERGELRYINDEPYKDYTDSIEYENNQTKESADYVSDVKGEVLRTPKNNDELKESKTAEKFLKDWGV